MSDLDSLDGLQFESIVLRLLQSMGLDVEQTQASGDGGIDIIARLHQPIIGGMYVIQCKRHAANIGEPCIRDLFGVVHHTRAAKGIVVTTSDFTAQARKFAEGKPIELINGEQFRTMLAKSPIGADSAGPNSFRVPPTMREFSRRIEKMMQKFQIAWERGLLRNLSTSMSVSETDFATDAILKIDELRQLLQNAETVCLHIDSTIPKCLDSRPNVGLATAAATNLEEIVNRMIASWDHLTTVAGGKPTSGFKFAVCDLFESCVRQFMGFLKTIADMNAFDRYKIVGDESFELRIRLDLEAEWKTIEDEMKRLDWYSINRQRGYVQ